MRSYLAGKLQELCGIRRRIIINHCSVAFPSITLAAMARCASSSASNASSRSSPLGPYNSSSLSFAVPSFARRLQLL